MQPFEFSAAAKAKEVMRCCASPLSLYSCLIYAFHRRRQGCRGCWERRNRREIRGSPSFVKGGKRREVAGHAGSGGKWRDIPGCFYFQRSRRIIMTAYRSLGDQSMCFPIGCETTLVFAPIQFIPVTFPAEPRK